MSPFFPLQTNKSLSESNFLSHNRANQAKMSTIARTCSQCGLYGHNSRTCTDTSGGAGSESPGENGIMLFGVRVNPAASAGFGGGTFRKSASMNNLSQFDQHNHESIGDAITDGYASDDVVHASARSHDRKRGVPWTEEEHKLFLLGLQKVGKGDWRGIARNYVKSRTPTQVASHAQKYFIRRSNHNRRRRRSSLFDITTDAVMGTSIAEEQVPQDTDFLNQHQQETNLIFNMEQSQINGDDSVGKLTLGQSSTANIISSTLSPKTICPIPFFPIPPSSKIATLKLETSCGETLPLTLKLSPTSTTEERTGPWALAPEVRTDNFNGNGSESTISVT